MLHVLLTILKVIGIIILIIIGLILLILAVILISPFRYQLEGEASLEGKQVYGQGKVTWLLHLIRVEFRLQNMEPEWWVKAAWLTLLKKGYEDDNSDEIQVQTDRTDENNRNKTEEKEFFEQLNEEVEKTEVKNVKKQNESYGGDYYFEEEPGEQYRSEPGSRENVSSGQKESKRVPEERKLELHHGNEEGEKFEPVKEERKENKSAGTDHNLVSSVPEEKPEIQETVEENEKEPEERISKLSILFQKIEHLLKLLCEKGKMPFRKLEHLCKSLEEKLDDLEKKITKISNIKDDILEFTEDTIHRKAFSHMIRCIRYLLKKYLPRKGNIHLNIGLDDPYLTGLVYVFLSLIDPLTGGNISGTPEPDRLVLEGNMNIKGRIRLIHILIILIRLAVKPSFWKTLKDTKQLKAKYS